MYGVSSRNSIYRLRSQLSRSPYTSPTSISTVARSSTFVARDDAGRLVSPDYEEATVRSTLRELGLDLDVGIPLDLSQRVFFDVTGDPSIYRPHRPQ
jgi:hypothetical protein